jgi:hypothetical protein
MNHRLGCSVTLITCILACAASGCGATTSPKRVTSTSSEHVSPPAGDPTADKRRFIARADGVCRRGDQVLTPIRVRLKADENAVDASLSADTLANRTREARDLGDVVTLLRSDVTALRALHAPTIDRSVLNLYLAGLVKQADLLDQLAASYAAPSGARISRQHALSLLRQTEIGTRVAAAQAQTEAAARSYGFRVCGVGR